MDAARDPITMLEWNPDGSKLLSSGSDYGIRIWTRFQNYTVNDPKPIATVMLPSLTETTFVMPAASLISPDGQWILRTDPISGAVSVLSTKTNQTKLLFSVTPLYNRYEQPDPDRFTDSNNYPWDQIVVAGSATNYFGWTAHSDLLVPDGQRYTVWSVSTGRLTGFLNLNPTSDLILRPDNKVYLTIQYADNYGHFHSFSINDVNTKRTFAQTGPVNSWHDAGGILGSAFSDERQLITLGQWSSDGRLIAFNDFLGGGVFSSAYVVIWDTKTNSFPVVLELSRTMENGSGGEGYVVAWSDDGTLIAVQGFNMFYLYRLSWNGNVLSAKLLLQRATGDTSVFTTRDRNYGIVFSPDSRYLFFNETIWDTKTLFPVFTFRAPVYYGQVYWNSDTLSFFLLPGQDDNGNVILGSVRTYRASDLLPKTCPPHSEAQLACVIGGVQ